MKIDLRVDPDIAEIMRGEISAAERAVTLATRDAGDKLKSDWRAQITRAGLGRKLSNTIRSRSYPRVGESIDAAALVWSKAPVIISAFDRGVTIKSSSGFFLAIPTPAAGRRGLGRRKLTPGSWEARTGIKLRFVYRPNGPSLLVADDARISKAGVASRSRSKRQGPLAAGSTTVPIFILVPQVRLRKRLDLERDVRTAVRKLPGMIVERWRDE